MSNSFRNDISVACLVICVLALTGCSSGGGGDGGGGDPAPSNTITGGNATSDNTTASNNSDRDTTALIVSSTAPAKGAISVARNVFVSAEFSKEIANDTADNTTFALTVNGTPVLGAVELTSANVVRFTPTSLLPYLTEVTATLTTGITDVTGNALTADYAWTFITGTGNTPEKAPVPTTGGTPVATGNASTPQVASNSSGNAIVVWEQEDTDAGTTHSIFARRYNPSNGWQPVEIIDESDKNAINPQVAIDGSGNAIVIWQQSNGSVFDIVAKRFTSTWGSVTPLDTATGDATNPQIAMNSSGVAMTVWQQHNGDNIDITARRLVANDWNTTTETIGNSTYAANAGTLAKDRQSRVAIDNAGNAIAVWRQYNGISNDIVARLHNGTLWSPTDPDVLDNEIGDSSNPQIAMDGQSNAIVVWEQPNPASKSIFANHHNGAGWLGAVTIESSSLQATYPQVSFDSTGNAVAAWTQFQNGNYSTVFANRYQPGSGWGTTPVALANRSEKGYASEPRIITDPQGQALVIWHQPDPSSNNSSAHIWITRYVGSQGWNSAPIRLDESGPYQAQSPAIGMDSNGNAIAAWSQQNNSAISNIWVTNISQ